MTQATLLRIAVLGAGAFGTALALALDAGGRRVVLWGRDADVMAALARDRTSRRLPGMVIPPSLSVVGDMPDLAGFDAVLIAVPMQALAGLVRRLPALAAPLIACCKGADLATGLGPVAMLDALRPDLTHALLTGPGFAADIARGLPTALTLACADDALGAVLQETFSTRNLRLYRTTDVRGAETGGALKNVMAIAAGVVIGAGLGDSARAAVMTRGYAEMLRFAVRQGALPQTLAGLSGFGDLVLTCTSPQSRNFRYGLALGAGTAFDAAQTVEGKATALALAGTFGADRSGPDQSGPDRSGPDRSDMPITMMVAALVDGKVAVSAAIETLLARPLKKE